MSDSTGCPVVESLAKDNVPLFSNGNINFKAHDVGWLIAAVFSIIATVASAWLIRKHLQFFYAPHQQRHIVRILFMVPIYAVTSLLSYLFYKHALYYQLIRDCYEAIVISSFFYLLLSYLSATPPTADNLFPAPLETREERAEQLRTTLRNVHVDKWMWPLGFIKWRPAGGGKGEGEAFLWLMRIGIGQYVILRPVSTLMAVISEAMGFYCLSSWSPRFMHIYTSTIVSVSVSIAMYCVLQLYWPLRKELQPYRPVAKFLSVKTVVFLTFWQETALGLLETAGAIKDHQYWSADEIVIGLAALLSCFEMMIFGFVHISAFTYLPYRALAEPLSPDGSTPSDSPAMDSTPLPKSFSAWTDLEKAAALASKKESKLRAVPSTVQLKPDGAAPRRQTRILPALWKCIWLSDVARELGDQTKYVARRKGAEVEAQRGREREEAMQEVFGGRRVVARGTMAIDEEEDDEGEDLGARLLRARNVDSDAPPPSSSISRPLPPKASSLMFDPSRDFVGQPEPTFPSISSSNRGTTHRSQTSPHSPPQHDAPEPTYPTLGRICNEAYLREVDSPLLPSQGPPSQLPFPSQRKRVSTSQERREALRTRAEEKAGWWSALNPFSGSESSPAAIPTFEQIPRREEGFLPPPRRISNAPTSQSFPFPPPLSATQPPPTPRLSPVQANVTNNGQKRGSLPIPLSPLSDEEVLDASDMLVDGIPPPHRISATATTPSVQKQKQRQPRPAQNGRRVTATWEEMRRPIESGTRVKQRDWNEPDGNIGSSHPQTSWAGRTVGEGGRSLPPGAAQPSTTGGFIFEEY